MGIVSRTGPLNRAAEYFGLDGDYSLLPRLKYNFYIEFILNEGITLEDSSIRKTFVFDRVSTVGLPDVDYGITSVNQYNRIRHVPTRMTVGTVPIAFYDTKDNQFQTLMKAYSQHYFNGHNLDTNNFSGYNMLGEQFQTGAGHPFGAKSVDQDKRFMFEQIKIHNKDSIQGGRTITLFNCMIQSINHDTLNYADSQPILYNVVFQPEHFNIDVLQNEQSEEKVQKSEQIIGNIPGVQTNRLPIVEKPPILESNAEQSGRAFTGSYDPSKETLRNVNGKTFVFQKNPTSGLAEGQLPQE
tara:strand:+ start:2603 stop:3496 length:894 start_codon:yes stop_codon:yes gene_type:complete